MDFWRTCRRPWLRSHVASAVAARVSEPGSGTAVTRITPFRASVVKGIAAPEASDNEVPDVMNVIGTSPPGAPGLTE